MYFIIIAICLVAGVAGAQPVDFGQLSPADVQQQLSGTDWFLQMPIWAQILLPLGISGASALLSAGVKDQHLGILAKVVNALGGNFGNAKGSQ